MPHPALAAGHPVGEERAHDRPPQPGAVADRVVDLRDGRDVVVHEPQRLAPERLEQPVGDEAVDLGAHDERVHADRPVNRAGALDGLRRGALAAAQLDEREQVDRVERVADGEALGMRHLAPASSDGRRPEVDEQNDDVRAAPLGWRPRAAAA